MLQPCCRHSVSFPSETTLRLLLLLSFFRVHPWNWSKLWIKKSLLCYFQIVGAPQPLVSLFSTSQQNITQLFTRGNVYARQVLVFVPTSTVEEKSGRGMWQTFRVSKGFKRDLSCTLLELITSQKSILWILLDFGSIGDLHTYENNFEWKVQTPDIINFTLWSWQKRISWWSIYSRIAVTDQRY